MSIILRNLLIAALLLAGSQAFAADAGMAGVREPKVTEEEASLLEHVAQLGNKEPAKAEQFLRGKVQPASSAAMDFALGNLAFRMEKYAEAKKHYRQALKKMPEFDRARANLARVLLQLDEVAAAKSELETVLRFGAQSASVMTLAGYVYLLDDKPVVAESAYRQALLQSPGDVNAYLGLAKALLMQDRYAEAARLLETVLKDAPGQGELWSNLANARLALEDFSGAVVALETARRLGVASFEALATLGDLYLNRAQYQDAVLAYSEAFAMENPSVPRMLRAAEGFLQVRQTKDAGHLMENIAKYAGQHPLTPDEAAQLQWLQVLQARLAGDWTQALERCQALVRREPLHGKALLTLGDLYAEKQVWDRAEIHYARASRINAVQVEAFTKMAKAAVAQEKYDRAIELLLEAQAIAPRETVAQYIEQLRYLRR